MAAPQNNIKARDNLETLQRLVERAQAELGEIKMVVNKAIATSLKVMADADEVLAGRL